METPPLLKQYAKSYLSQKKDVLWGQHYDLTDEGRLDAAADFLAREIQGVSDLMGGGVKN